MSGIIAVYALVVAVLIAGNMKPPSVNSYSLFQGFLHLACGLSVGLTGLAAGYAIGKVGDTVSQYIYIQEMRYRWGGADDGYDTGSAELHAAVEDLRGDGADSNFWGGAWALWVSCGYDGMMGWDKC